MNRFAAAPATFGIVALTVLVSLFVTLTGADNWAAVNAGFIPARLTYGDAPALDLLLPGVLTPLSATLVHGGLLHLVMNMVLLVYAGFAVERALGTGGTLLLYVVGGYAAAAAQWLPDPQSAVPMIGASGAASAILGAQALLFGRSRARAIGPVPAGVVNALWLFVAWTILNLAVAAIAAQSGFGIAAPAHIGGFAAGLLLARPLLAWRWRQA